MLIKIPTGDGHYRYALSPEENVVLSRSRINRLFQDSLIKVDHSLNQVVLHTIPGSAQSVAFSIDHAKWTEIIGTLAGDVYKRQGGISMSSDNQLNYGLDTDTIDIADSVICLLYTS